jgi:iron-sulfur cluster assembly protein
MISLTEQAASQLRQLMQQQGVNDIGLRVLVTPGGCSGFNYGMNFEDEELDGDRVVSSNGISVYVDEFSAQYLEGAEIDWDGALLGGGFSVHNPNAISACSCGQSFTAADGAGSARACGH